ncbi:hypothetical protein A9G24_04675 [Gilliamella sp. App6-5]|uniref:hypothetical protein n=1 Tax=Gilliamella sp. App6-5 TaxID=3120232 RepID=UPI00080DA288|nr:hypothetical protein [Gilliamella apicola]OCG16296.1 hypothetical protein A9G24_04675 [Gilliamella apicola]
MGLPKEFRTEQILALENELKNFEVELLENLTNEDFRILGMYIQTDNFIDLNIRRCFNILKAKGILITSQKELHIIPNLVNKIISCLSELNLSHEQRKEAEEKLEEIKFRRNHRNIFAHFAAKRIPNQDAIVFMTNDPIDMKKIFKQISPSDAIFYAIYDIADIRGLVKHVLSYENWLAEFTSMIIKI